MASRSVSDILLPIFSKVFSDIKTSIKYIGFSVVYGSKDFSNEYSSPNYDYILIVMPTSVAMNFTSGFITDQEAVNKSDIYIYPYGGEIRKTNLTLQ